ncbi:MAG: OmpH family outer membrane protein [Thermodesulfobacteriota bacterium]
MKKIIFLTLTMILLAVPALAAQKIGTVNLQKVMTASEPAQKALGQLQSKSKSIQEKLESKKQEVQSLREDMEKQKMVMSQEAKMDKETELKRKIRDLQDEARAFQRQIKQEQNNLTEPILKILQEVIEEYGQKHDYSMIMDTQNSGLLFAKESMDITDKIIVELNKAWRAAQKDNK